MFPRAGFVLVAALNAVGWFGLTWWRIHGRAAIAWLSLVILTSAWALGLTLWFAQRDYCYDLGNQLVVIKKQDVILRKGDGMSYPARKTPALVPGQEAECLFVRGNWLQIHLPTGEVGWIPASGALTAGRGAWSDNALAVAPAPLVEGLTI
jgi:hypothetical protein